MGEGPSAEPLSSFMLMSPDRPPSTRSCSQTSSTTVGGFAAGVVLMLDDEPAQAV